MQVSGAVATCGKIFLKLVVSERRRRRLSLLLFLVSLGKLGGDVYIVLLPCVYVVDGAQGFIGELFLVISYLSVLDKAVVGPISAATTTMTATTASAYMAWSTAAAWVRDFDAVAITLIPDKFFLIKDNHRPAWRVAKEVIDSHI